MADLKVAVGTVEAFEDSGTDDATLRLSDGSVQKVSRKSPKFAFLADWIKKKIGTGRPVYVEYDSGTGEVDLILPPALRRIARVGPEPEGDHLPVEVVNSSTRHFLRTTRPAYKELRQVLEGAVKSKSPLLVTIHPEHMDILDARQPPAGLNLTVI
jgi:hypothetical protein